MGDSKKGDGQGFSDLIDNDGGCTWAPVVQEIPRGPCWTFHRITEKDI